MNSVDNIKSVALLIRFYKNKYLYGVLNRLTGQAYPDKDDLAWRNWRLNTPLLTLNSGTGNCYDTVLLSKKVLDNLKVPYSTYFGINKYRDGVLVPSHSFLVYKDKDKYKWLLGSWGPYKNNKYTSRDKLKLVHIIAKLMSQTAKADQLIFQLKDIPYGSDIHTYDETNWSQPAMFVLKFKKKASVKLYKGGTIPLDKLLKIILLLKQLDKYHSKYLKDFPSNKYAEELTKHLAKLKRYNDPKQTVFVYLDKLLPVGISSMVKSRGLKDTGYIHSVFVSPLFRGKKIGTDLLKAILKRARQRKMKHLLLGYITKNPSSKFYDKLGYKPMYSEVYKEL